MLAGSLLSGANDRGGGSPLHPAGGRRGNLNRQEYGSGNVSRDTLDLGLVGSSQFDHVTIGIAYEHRNAAIFAEPNRPLSFAVRP